MEKEWKKLGRMLANRIWTSVFEPSMIGSNHPIGRALSQSAQTAIKKIPEAGLIKQQRFIFLTVLDARKSKIKVSAEVDSREGSRFCLQMMTMNAVSS